MAQAQDVPSVRRVQVLGNRNPVEIEIEASDRLVPETQVLTGPDRLVVDFANAVPGAQLRNQILNRGEVKSVRVGLFTSKPPVTRVVIDLNGPQAYQVFPSGRTVIIKIGSAGAARLSGLNLLAVRAKAGEFQLSRAVGRRLRLPRRRRWWFHFRRDCSPSAANKASLSEVLFAVHQRTGADIAIPAGAEQEKVVAEIGPASCAGSFVSPAEWNEI